MTISLYYVCNHVLDAIINEHSTHPFSIVELACKQQAYVLCIPQVGYTAWKQRMYVYVLLYIYVCVKQCSMNYSSTLWYLLDVTEVQIKMDAFSLDVASLDIVSIPIAYIYVDVHIHK